ncbi:alpha/beta hydrolase family protein [Alteromonas sp. H39]|uniref:alpha/beta hydrolase family protein n=1 Tax=Alteromonas sp. H39 TaxID=3389876 RepID=UPI0039DF579A
MKMKKCLSALSLLLTLNAVISSTMAAEVLPQSLYLPISNEVLPELSAAGTFSVGVKTIDVNIGKQPLDLAGNTAQRHLKLQVWYPAQATTNQAIYENQTRSGKPFALQGNAYRDAEIASSETSYPVVILSHGYTGYRTIMYYLGEHLASHGYVVAGIDHTGSTNADIDMKNAPYAGFPGTLLNRSRDQQQALNAVQNHPAFRDAVAKDAAGLIGYSMGGFGAVNTVGGCFDFSEAAVKRLTGMDAPEAVKAVRAQLNTCAAGMQTSDDTDPRWKAMVAMAPWGGQFPVFDKAAMEKIQVPTLYVGGEYDDISGYQGIRWLYENTTGTPAYLLTINNARHNIAPHPAPMEAMASELDLGHYYEPAWRTQSLNEINKHFALAMMNCYVKARRDDCEYLSVRGSSAQSPVDGEVPAPWKGFDNRYALGLTIEANAQAEK